MPNLANLSNFQSSTILQFLWNFVKCHSLESAKHRFSVFLSIDQSIAVRVCISPNLGKSWGNSKQPIMEVHTLIKRISENVTDGSREVLWIYRMDSNCLSLPRMLLTSFPLKSACGRMVQEAVHQRTKSSTPQKNWKAVCQGESFYTLETDQIQIKLYHGCDRNCFTRLLQILQYWPIGQSVVKLILKNQ